MFGLDLGTQGGPDWVIGDAFLKNVYSVFRFSPGPSVGFAQLAGNEQGKSSLLPQRFDLLKLTQLSRSHVRLDS
jgi:hypothetical protein